MRIAIACNSMPDILERIILKDQSKGSVVQKPECLQKTWSGGYKIAWIARQGDEAVQTLHITLLYIHWCDLSMIKQILKHYNGIYIFYFEKVFLAHMNIVFLVLI